MLLYLNTREVKLHGLMTRPSTTLHLGQSNDTRLQTALMTQGSLDKQFSLGH